VFFFLAVLFSGSFNASLLTNIPPEEGGSSFLPKGIAGIFPALPFAIWFYLAIEELPLAAEESHDPKRDIPRATIWGLNTLVLFAVLTLFLNTGVDGGAKVIGVSATPLFDGFIGVFGEGTAAGKLESQRHGDRGWTTKPNYTRNPRHNFRPRRHSLFRATLAPSYPLRIRCLSFPSYPLCPSIAPTKSVASKR